MPLADGCPCFENLTGKGAVGQRREETTPDKATNNQIGIRLVLGGNTAIEPAVVQRSSGAAHVPHQPASDGSEFIGDDAGGGDVLDRRINRRSDQGGGNIRPANEHVSKGQILDVRPVGPGEKRGIEIIGSQIVDGILLTIERAAKRRSAQAVDCGETVAAVPVFGPRGLDVVRQRKALVHQGLCPQPLYPVDIGQQVRIRRSTSAAERA